MAKKILIISIAAFVFCCQGCQTLICATNGAVEGSKKDYQSVKCGKNFVMDKIMKFDAWIQEHMW